MSTFIHDFFRDGREDALAEVCMLQSCGQWTKEKRARWIREAVSCHERLRHTHPSLSQGMSYYAGRIVALKSRLTADGSEETSRCKEMINTPLARRLHSGSLLLCSDCCDFALWQVVLKGTLPVSLCNACKQERVRMQTYSTPDGWDWDEDEEEDLPPLPVLGGGKLVVREPLEVRSIFLPCTTVVGLGLLDMTLHVPILLFVMQAVLFLHFIVWGKGILKKFPRWFESEL